MQIQSNMLVPGGLSTFSISSTAQNSDKSNNQIDHWLFHNVLLLWGGSGSAYLHHPSTHLPSL